MPFSCYNIKRNVKGVDTCMTVKRILSSMEASFNMEGFRFDDDCRKRVENILESRLTVADAISELNRKYGVS